MAQRLETDPDAWFDTYLFDLACERDGEDAVRAVVQEASRGDARIAAYFNDVAKWDTPPSPRPPTTSAQPYAALEPLILEARGKSYPFYPLRRWGRYADEQDLRHAAEDLLHERDPVRFRAYLLIFWDRSFPLDPERIIANARSTDDDLAREAINALRHIQGGNIRALAIELMKAPDRRHLAVDLLKLNYAEGDHALIEQALSEQPDDINRYHWLGYGALDVFESNPTAAAAPALTTLYNTDPCSACRERSVKLLFELHKLPDWMLEEIQFDANYDLRDRVQGFTAGPSG